MHLIAAHWGPRKRRLPSVSVAAGGAFGLLAVAAVAAALLTLSLADLARNQQQAARATEHALQVLAVASTLDAALDALAVADSRAALDHAGQAAAPPLTALQNLTEGDPAPQAALARLAPLIAARRAIPAEAEAPVVPADPQALSAPLQDLRAQTAAWLRATRSAADAAARRAALHLALGGALGAASAVIAVAILVAGRRERRVRSKLPRLRAALNAQVDARTAIAASAARQRSYFTHLPVGCVVLRLAEGGFVLDDINPAAAAIYGLAGAPVVGQRLNDVWPDAIARDKEPRLRHCLDRQRAMTYSAVRELHGQVRLLDVTLTPLPEPSGRSRRILCCVQDVTAQRALERQVTQDAERRSEAIEREAALFRNSTDLLALVRVLQRGDGPCFVYETLSVNLESLTGLQAERMIGQRPEDCIPAALASQASANYRRCLEADATVQYSITCDLPIGTRDLEGSITPIRHPVTGRITHLANALRDVTERNRTEAARRHGQKMEAIGRLAAGVAHDFNNLLQGVTGALELLLDKLADASEAEALAAMALAAAERGSYLTQHLLSYARKQVLQPQVLNPAACLTDLQALLARTLGPHIRVVVRAASSLPPLHADPGQLQTALLNLAINAADAMPRTGVLTLAADAIRTPGQIAGRTCGNIGVEDWIDVSVIDTGTGMDAATLAQVFEPFFSTKGAEGVGLGLSMVQGFAVQSGGVVRINSVPGQGTTVVLRLPAASAADTGSRPDRRRAILPHACGRVLLVDDAPDVLLTTSAFLEGAGLTVLRATAGDRVLDLLAAGERFDAVVTDYAMPGMNGIDLIAEVRALQPDMPAVIITGYADLDSNAELPPDVGVLYKPFPRERLVEALRRAMARGMADQDQPA